MPFDWKQYLLLAEFLQANADNSPSKEAAYRCAVSRAYYAAFCHARNFARDHYGFIPQSGVDDHGRVRAIFRQKRRHDIASALDDLRDWRNQCDYDDDVASLSTLVSSSIARSVKVFSVLGSLKK